MSLTATQNRRASTADRAHTPSWGTLLVLLAAVFITTLDFFIVNVAIPSTQQDLHASAAAIQWVVAGFGLALAAGLITGGRLGDIFGRRRMFAIGLALFTVASAACGLAPTAEALVAGRVAQGIAAALLMPQVLGIVNVVFTGEHRAKAFTAYGLTLGFAGVFGQLIGGALIQADIAGLGWRAIFWINVPIGVVALALTRPLVPESKGTGSNRLDLVGTALVSASLVAIVLPLVQGRQDGWPAWTWVSLAASPLILGAFAAYQRRLTNRNGAPLIAMSLFKERAFSAGLGFSLMYSLGQASFFLVLALYLQQGHGLTALNSGLIFSALGAGYFAASVQAGKVAARIGRQVLAAGSLVQVTGYLVLLVTITETGVTGGIGWLIPGLVIVGAGMGLVMAPMSAIVLAGVAPHNAASAAGVLSTAQQVGGALGVAIIGIVFYDAIGSHPVPHTFGHAFTESLFPLMAFCLTTTLITQLLPRPAAK
jgi:EmrB/QacA subfamily drug resistance transporter